MSAIKENQAELEPKLSKLCSRRRILAGLTCLSLGSLVMLYSPADIILLKKDVLHFEDNKSEDGLLAPIVFLETSAKSTLTLREACVIESAAYHNWQRNVTVLSISKLRVTPNHMRTLVRKRNINLQLLNLSALFEGTPLEVWYKMKLIKDSQYPVHHLSDAARLAILWKHGGIYLDTDALIIRSLNNLSNSVSEESENVVANGILIFDKSSPFLNECMIQFTKDYHQNEWSYQGPQLVTRILKQFCGTDNLGDVVNRPECCRGIRLLPQHTFLPVPWQQWKRILRESNLTKFSLAKSYSVHLFGSLSHTTPVKPMSGVLLDFLARRHCPQIYQWMLTKSAL